MASFRYEARETGGRAVSGTVEARSRQAALQELSALGLFPSRLEDTSDASPARARSTDRGEAEAAQDGKVAGRVRRREVTAFTREMATLLTASIPIPAALEGLGEEEGNEALRRVLRDLAAAVRQGEALSDAMAAYPKLFSTLYVSMVRVGEEAGALDKVLSDLAELLETEDEVRGEVLGAVAYPAFVMVMGIITTIVLLAFVLPRLFEMLQEMTDLLPLPTRVLLGASQFFTAHWLWLAIGAVGVFLLGRAYLRSSAGRLQWDRWKLRLPLLGAVFRASSLGRLARTLGTLVRSGVSLLPALEIARRTVGNAEIAKSIEEVAEETRGGKSLAAPLRKRRIFPPTMLQMIAVGEDTGTLDVMLLRVASMLQKQLRGHSRTLISLLAPALILIVGGIVGFIVIALLLPIFQLSQAIG